MTVKSNDSFKTRDTMKVGSRDYTVYDLAKLTKDHPQVAKLPFSLRVLLENLLRHEDGRVATKDDVMAVVNWEPTKTPDKEIAYHPARVLLQDFTGVRRGLVRARSISISPAKRRSCSPMSTVSSTA
jgi:aconitate hydratase